MLEEVTGAGGVLHHPPLPLRNNVSWSYHRIGRNGVICVTLVVWVEEYLNGKQDTHTSETNENIIPYWVKPIPLTTLLRGGGTPAPVTQAS